MRQYGPDATAKQVRDFIASEHERPGVDGVYDFVKVPQRGLDISDGVITQWNPAAQTWETMSKAGGAPLP